MAKYEGLCISLASVRYAISVSRKTHRYYLIATRKTRTGLAPTLTIKMSPKAAL
jgi:hypothetical protein